MKTRTITIPKKDIFFDVDAATHIYAKMNEAANLRRSDAVESDTGDLFSEHVLTRFADRRAGELGERLARFLSITTDTEHTVVLSSATSYTFSLYVEDAFEDELLIPLADAMEGYIAHGATADWFMAAGDAQGSAYLQMTASDIARILEYLVKRKFPARS